MKTLKLEKTIPASIISLDFDTRYADIVNLEISYVIITDLTDPSEEEIMRAHLDQNVGFAKINVFLENMIDGCVAITAEASVDPAIRETIDRLDNNVLMLPDLTEVTLMSALISKMNAITAENTSVRELSIRNVRDKVTYSFMCDEQDDSDYDDLPTAKEWLGEFPYWEKTWWERDDISTYDRGAKDEEELKNWKKNAEEQRIDELNKQTFREVEQDVTAIFLKVANQHTKEEHAGELIEVDFSKKNKT
jgi:hypothetical protein